MIKITNLNKYYNKNKANEIHVVNDATLSFPEKGLVTIFGESGSGKTTLLNLIGGLDSFHSGAIEIDGQVITKYSSKNIDEIRNQKIGYIFQNYLLLGHKTVYENIDIVLSMYNLSQEEKNKRIDYVLKAVEMYKYKKKLVSELSGGQQQRVAISRALIKSPSLILADEPTGNLDEKNTIQIMNILKKISKDILVILVSHEKKMALSYSDYVVEIKDGKIVNNSEVYSNSSYQYEDDQNIYLKDYSYQEIKNDKVSLSFYSNENSPISLKIIEKNGRFYLSSTSKIILLNDSSEVKIIDDHKKKLEVEKEVDQNNYSLEPLEYVKSPSLSLKEQVKIALKNNKTNKKKTFIMSFPLLLIIIALIICVQSIVSASQVDRKHLGTTHSKIYNISLETLDPSMDKEVFSFGFSKFYDELLENNPNVEPVLNVSSRFTYTKPSFNQIGTKTYDITEFSLIPLSYIDSSKLIYGRMPNNASEIVVEKWVLEKALEGTTLKNFMDVKSFVNSYINLKNKDDTFKIVGISSTEENAIYMNKWYIVNLYPSDIRSEGYKVCSYSEIEEYLGKEIKKPEGKYSAIKNSSRINELVTSYELNNDSELVLSFEDSLDLNGLPFDIVVSDCLYPQVIRSVLKANPSTLDLFIENQKDRVLLEEFILSRKDYYSSGELIASRENGFISNVILEDKIVKFSFEGKSIYDSRLAPYIEDSKKAVNSRLIISFSIVLVSVLIVYFTMKSFAISGMKDIGIYRSIGISKNNILFIYAIQSFIISLKTTFIGGSVCFIISNLVSILVPVLNYTPISFGLYILITLSMIILNVLIGIIPISTKLRLTPSEILSRYDV
ncbi:MAG: ATP-binding cassette domain-containing protein [Bacilli bacterium]|nr:ATP-binding cassette domain-containing protein [Bacillales bacterium]MDY2575444.1 ATP-binding cassette domain-containing protein [Bacilli bacterium]